MTKRKRIEISKIDSICDVQVEGRVEQVVLIWANSKGRKVVEDLWPDVKWDADEKNHPNRGDWLFTHIRVTRLPPFYEAAPDFSTPDALGFAVAVAIQRRAEPQRVGYFTGYGADITLNFVRLPPAKPGLDLALYAEHVPPGTAIGGTPGWPQ